MTKSIISQLSKKPLNIPKKIKCTLNQSLFSYALIRKQSVFKSLVIVTLIGMGLLVSLNMSIAQTLVIQSPASNTCIPNITPIQIGGLPGEEVAFESSNVPLSLIISEPNGDAVSIIATINGEAITLSRNIIDLNVANTELVIDNLYIPADQVNDGVGLVLAITLTSPAGVATQSVTFDLDRIPPTLTFNAQNLSLYAGCESNTAALIQTIQPQASDLFDPSPSIDYSDSSYECEHTRVITAKDHCGVGNAQEVFFQMRTPAPDNIDEYEISFFGVEESGQYLESSINFSVDRDFNCFQFEGILSRNGAAAENFIRGTSLDVPGDYQLIASLIDCAERSHSEDINFSILEQPIADTGGPYQGIQGTAILLDASDSFSPAELGGIVDYSWNFDVNADAGNYNQVGAQVEFLPADDGLFSIGLRIRTGEGQIREAFTTIHVDDLSPICNAGGPYEVQEGAFLTADGSASLAGVPTEPIVEYHWDFGESDDLNDLSDQRSGVDFIDPMYFYQSEGAYELRLTVYDRDSFCTDTAQVNVTPAIPYVRNVYVVAGVPLREGEELTFTAEEANTNSFTRPIQSFLWEWGYDNAQSQAAGNTLRFARHTFPDDGEFDVCLTIEDGLNSAQECTTITIIDVNPRVFIDGPIFAVEGQSASFELDGTREGSSYDPLREIVINWGDGEVEVIADPTQTEVTHIFRTNGNLMVQVEAFDEDSSSFEFFPIFVDDVSPDVHFTTIGNLPTEGISSLWSAAQTQPGALSDDITSYRWDWGDGDISEGAELETAEHIWADNGQYLLSLTVYDEDSSSTRSQLVQVFNRAPYEASIITAKNQVDVGEEVSFEVTFQDVPSDIVSIYWRMGEGSTFTNRRTVGHRYQTLGIFTVRVSLTDEDGGETEVTYDIEVMPAGPLLLVPEIANLSEGDLLSFDVEVRAALDTQGNFDGPVSLSVLRVPHGMQWTALESDDEQRSKRYRFTWATGAGDAGQYDLRFKAKSPSGIERLVERNIQVQNTQEVYLATLGGSLQQALVSLYQYIRNPILQSTHLALATVIPIGQGIGDLLQHHSYLFASAPHSGHVAVIDPHATHETHLIRTIPVTGQPYALLSYLDDLWIFDAYNGRISLVNSVLKVYRQAYVDELTGVLDVLAWSDPEQDQAHYLFILTRRGELMVLNAQAIINQQANQIVVQRHNLDTWRVAASTLPGLYNKSKAIHGQLNHWLIPANEANEANESNGSAESTSLIVALLARDLIAFNPESLLQNRVDLTPRWIMRSHFTLDDILYQSNMIWATSPQGLRRFILPNLTDEMNDLNTIRQSGEVLNPNSHGTITHVPRYLLDEESILVTQDTSINHYSQLSQRLLLSQNAPKVYKVLMMQYSTQP
jgi:PKD repeat protein